MRKQFPILALVLAAAMFTAGVIYLFLLRFEAGDVYPPYSSLRADPLGTMALCESLAKLPGLRVRRDTSDANKLPEERNTTYLHLAAEPQEWRSMSDEMFTEIEGFANRGGRLLITLRPVVGWDPWLGRAPVGTVITNTATTNAPGKNPPTSRKSSGRKSSGIPFQTLLRDDSLARRWGVDFGRVELKQGDDDVYQPAEVLKQSEHPLPPSLDWHSSLVLTNVASSWQTIYARGQHPVMVERKFGRGSVVLATDSYFLSNQAMWQEREPELLAWLIGPAQHIVFDESHLGVVESSGVAVLLRKYRLSGVVGALVLLAGLFIWKNSFSLVPPHAGETRSPFIPGKDATAGFVNLLRRNIPPRQILEVCFEQWTHSLLNRANYRIAAVDQAQAIMERERARPATARNAIQAYREISAALKNPRPPTAHPTPDTPHPAPTK